MWLAAGHLAIRKEQPYSRWRRGKVSDLGEKQRLSALLEVLDRTLMSLSCLSRAECAKVPTPSRLRILLAGEQPVMAGLEFPNHRPISMQVASTTTPSQTSLPSVRCTHGRVKLSALTFRQRWGTTKFARLGAAHPVAGAQNTRTIAAVAVTCAPQKSTFGCGPCEM